MGTLTFQVIDAIDGTLSKSYTNFSDADITKWIATYQSAANTSVNGTATRAQVLNYIITQAVNGWVSATQVYNASIASAAAMATAPTISIT